MLKHYVFAFKLYSAGVDNGKSTPAPFGVGVNSVARDARSVLYYGYSASAYFIKKSRFTHVGATDYRYYRFFHIFILTQKNRFVY